MRKQLPRFSTLILLFSCGCLFSGPSLAQSNPPAITLHPTGKSVSIGGRATFSVGASGTQPLFYQWHHDSTPIENATNASLSVSNIVMADAGGFQAIVTNAWGAATSMVAVLNVDPTFTKITTGLIATDGGDSSGAAWGDYDHDGFIDLFVGNNATANALYRNNGDGTFTRVTNAATFHRGYGCAWGDFNNDGNLDLLASFQSTNYLYRNEGGGVFTAVPGFLGAVSWCGTWADYDRDGWLDLYIANGGGQNDFLFRNNGTGSFTRITSGSLVTSGGTTVAGSWADYNEDGWPDLYTANNGGTSPLYRNNGNGTFTQLVSAPFNESGGAIVADWGDYDNDGHLDLAVSRLGQNFLFHNNGNGSFTKITTGAIVTDSQLSEICQWGDYDNDGFLDLFVANDGGGQNNALYHNNGDGSFTRINTGSIVNDGGRSAGGAWGDYDRDGFLDLFVPNWQGSRPNFLYRNNGNSNAWLKVDCIGGTSNRGGVGAKVRVKAFFAGATRWQVREINGSIGFGQTPGANFGLGNALQVEVLRIEWPSGIVQERYNLGINQAFTIIEPPLLRNARLSNTNFQFDLVGVMGSNYVVEASMDLPGSWNEVATLVNTNRTTPFTTPLAPDGSARFYRARLQ